jgi:hypothetical protein
MHPYLEIFLKSSVITPLVWMFFKLDPDPSIAGNAIWITIWIYTIMYILTIVMFNYLQTGNIFKHRE